MRQVDRDAVVQNTDNDAATSRQSAVNAGYLEDPFSLLMGTAHPVTRRLPLMNRGRTVGAKLEQKFQFTFGQEHILELRALTVSWTLFSQQQKGTGNRSSL